MRITDAEIKADVARIRKEVASASRAWDQRDRERNMSNEPLKEGWSDTKENPDPANPKNWPPAKFHPPDGLDITGPVARVNAMLQQPSLPPKFDPPPTKPQDRYLDIPVGEGDDRRLASIPFGISVSDVEMIQDMIEKWRTRLTLKL